ncbi:MAG: PilZ domain-containing protein [Nitrospirae bacterium]|nr:PilZ domain-containing protein [Nitrospirota bacterium]
MVSFYLKKRAYERIRVNIQVNYFFNNEGHSGTLTDLSINGMYIEADESLPFKSKTDSLNPFKSYCIVYVPFREGKLKLIVKVRRVVKADEDYSGMGVELVNPPPDYLEFVSSIRNYCLITAPQGPASLLKTRTT